MQVRCPNCDAQMNPEDVNVGADTAFCRKCDEAFALSKLIHMEEAAAVDLDHPPKGAWFERTFDGFTVGATTRHPAAFFIVPFMCVWSGGSLGGIYGSQIATGNYSVILSLFGIPFLLFSILFWAIALMTVCGRVVLKVEGTAGGILTGVGSIGRKKLFNWLDVSGVREQQARADSPGHQGAKIVLEGKERVEFGKMLRQERRYFIVQVLRKMLAERDSR